MRRTRQIDRMDVEAIDKIEQIIRSSNNSWTGMSFMSINSMISWKNLRLACTQHASGSWGRSFVALTSLEHGWSTATTLSINLILLHKSLQSHRRARLKGFRWLPATPAAYVPLRALQGDDR